MNTGLSSVTFGSHSSSTTVLVSVIVLSSALLFLLLKSRMTRTITTAIMMRMAITIPAIAPAPKLEFCELAESSVVGSIEGAKVALAVNELLAVKDSLAVNSTVD